VNLIGIGERLDASEAEFDAFLAGLPDASIWQVGRRPGRAAGAPYPSPTAAARRRAQADEPPAAACCARDARGGRRLVWRRPGLAHGARLQACDSARAEHASA